MEALCRNRGSLLILDEVQTGFGRTGTMFACQHYDIQPDIICVAKAMAGGLPVGAVLCSDLVKEIPTMSHGNTFGGSHIVCAAALGTLSVLQNSGIIQHAREMGIYFRERLETLDLRIIREIRGLGLMIGLELKSRVSPVLKGLMDHGILALPAGNTVLRFFPPLSITADDIDQVVDALKIVLKPLDKISTEESTE